MRIDMELGRRRLALEVAESNRIASRPIPAPLPDAAAAVRAALEAPHRFPPLRRALTPDDRLAVVVEGPLPEPARLLVPLLEHIVSAGVAPAAITVLCPAGASTEWVDELPEALEDVHVESHDPTEKRRLAYLATMASGKRLYLNRTAVEADLVVVLTARRYDLLLGHAGGEGALYPTLADEASRQELTTRINLNAPGEAPWALRQQALEATWLLGQPFFVQIIPGPGDSVAHVVAGAADACREGVRLHDACWRRTIPQTADVVVTAISGDPARHTFADLAAAVGCAARVVRAAGRIILLSDARPVLGAAEALRRHDEPSAAFAALLRKPTPEMAPALQWAHAAEHAHLSVLSGLPAETVEELFATPLTGVEQVQRQVNAGGACLFLQDAHKTMAVVG